MKKVIFLLMLLLPITCQATITVFGDGESVLWQNNSQTFSIAASGSMSESVDYLWMPADGQAGQAIVTDGSGILSWSDASTAFSHNLLSATHTDTLTDSPTRGSLIYGNSTPKWDEFVIGTGFLKGDGTDVTGWSTVTLTTDTTGNYVASITDGLAIDGGDGGSEGAALTIAFDPTELLGNRTWGDASTDTIVWTWNRATGTDPAMTFGNDFISLNGDLKILGDDLFMTTNTNRFVLMGDGTNYNPEAIDLGTDTTGNYVATVADGTGIDGTATGEGSTYTPSFDATELNGLLWGTGSENTLQWQWDLIQGDPIMSFGNFVIIFNSDLSVVSGGDFTLGNTQWNSGDEIDGTKIKDADYGDVDVSVGGAWTVSSVQNNSVALTTDTTGNYAAGDAEAGNALTGDSASSFFSSGTLEVAIGGTGATSLTDGGILLGSGVGAITALGVASNGQIPIGDGATDPVLATITGSSAITVTNGAGSITLDVNDTGVDHGGLTGLGDDDHTQYIKDSEFTQNSGILVGTGSGTFQEETGATLRTSIGLGILDSPQFTNLTILGDAEDNARVKFRNESTGEVDLWTDEATGHFNIFNNIQDGDISFRFDDGGAPKTVFFDASENLFNMGDTALTTTGLGTFGNLDVDTLNLNGNVISDSTGTISFNDDNLTTTGTLGAGAITGTSLTDGTATLDDGSLASAVNGTFSGTVQAEQLTSTDDITMAGKLTNTPLAADHTCIRIDGDTNPATALDGTNQYGMYLVRNFEPPGTAGATMTNAFVFIDVDHPITESTFAVTDTIYGTNQTVQVDSAHTAAAGIQPTITENIYGTFNSTLRRTPTDPITADKDLTINNYGLFNQALTTVTFNKAGRTLTSNVYGMYGKPTNTPSLTAGDIIANTYGGYFEVVGNAAGTSKAYGLYIASVSGADENWGIYDISGADSLIAAKLCFTQTDKNEFIDSLNDGYLDYSVTTAHRFNMSAADTDVRVEFIGTTNSGLFEWMEDEDRFDFADSIRVGDGTNNVSVATDGFITLTGTARASEDMQFVVKKLKPGASAPTEAIVGITPVFQFDTTTDDEAHLVFEILHNYDNGTDFRAHFHWAPTNGNAGDVTWGIEYHITRDENNEVLTEATTTAIIVDATQSLQDEVLETGNIIISGSGVQSEDHMHIRIFRDADASEAGASDTYASDASLISFDVEYMIDGFGEDSQF